MTKYDIQSRANFPLKLPLKLKVPAQVGLWAYNSENHSARTGPPTSQ